MKEFNYDPASESENEWHEVWVKDVNSICHNNKSIISESYKNCEFWMPYSIDVLHSQLMKS